MIEFFPFALFDASPFVWPDSGSPLGLGLGIMDRIEPTVLVALFSLLSSLVTWLITRSNNSTKAEKDKADANLQGQRSVQGGYEKLVQAMEQQIERLIEHVDDLTREVARLKNQLGDASLHVERLERTIRDSGIDLPPHNRE